MNIFTQTSHVLGRILAVLAIIGMIAGAFPAPVLFAFAEEPSTTSEEPTQGAPEGNENTGSPVDESNDTPTDTEEQTDQSSTTSDQNPTGEETGSTTPETGTTTPETEGSSEEVSREASSARSASIAVDPVATIVATKVVCDSESDLPNWGNGGPKINATTATDWVASHSESCRLARDWSFEWGKTSASNPDNNVLVAPHTGPGGAGWNTFGPSGANGVATAYLTASDIGDGSFVWMREVLQPGYIGFTYGTDNRSNSNPVSAEMYCHTDVRNFDNFDRVDGIELGETYYCVAWNVEKPADTVDITMCKYDQSEYPVEGWEMLLKNDYEGEGAQSYEATTGEDGCVTVAVDPDEGPWYAYEETRTGWSQVDAYADGGMVYEDEEGLYCAFFAPDRVEFEDERVVSKIKDYDEGYRCTFYNEEDEVEIPRCENLLTNGSFEDPVVTNSSLYQFFTTPLGWTVKKVSDNTSTDLEFHRGWSGNAAAYGQQYVELDPYQSVRIAQSVTTIPGATYALKWAFAARHNIDGAQNQLGVEVNGTQVATEGPATGVSPLTVGDWVRNSTTFTASGSSTEVAFKDIGTPSDSYGTFLDDAQLCLVRLPEVPKTCSVTIVSDATNTVVEKGGAFAKLLSVINPGWTAGGDIGGLAEWIWGDDPVVDGTNATTQTFQKTFGWNGPVTSAVLTIAADNGYEVTVNGDVFGGDPSEFNYASPADVHNLTSFIDQGNNTLSIEVDNFAQEGGTPESNPAGLKYSLTITGTDPECDVPYRDPENSNDDEIETENNDGDTVTRTGRRSTGTPRVLGEATSTPQVLGDQVSAVPYGAPDTGAGGSTAATLSLLSILYAGSRRHEVMKK